MLKVVDSQDFSEKIKKEREILMAAWMAFLGLQKEKQLPLPRKYAEAFERALKVEKKENVILDLLVEGKELFLQLIKNFNPEIANRLGIAETMLSLMNYIKRIEDLEKELSFLRESFLRDSLTGLWNKNALDKFFKEVVIQNLFEEDYLLCYLDLDRFKQINDNYGHKWGDKALVAFADFLKKNFKKKDFVCRLHGDEFCVVITGTPFFKVIPFIERLYQNGFKVTFPDNKVKHICFSIGLTNILGSDTLEKALERADFSMYCCKNKKKLKPVRV